MCMMMDATALTLDENASAMQVLLKQEASASYSVLPVKECTCPPAVAVEEDLNDETDSHSDDHSVCDDDDVLELRSAMIDIFYDIGQQCQFRGRHDTIAIAVSYLDRFSHLRQGRFFDYKLVAMVCLYIAVKTHEPVAIPPAMMCELFEASLGNFQEEDDFDDEASTCTTVTVEALEDTEYQVLETLTWRLHPPTSFAWVRHLLCSIPPDQVQVPQWKSVAQTLASLQLEQALRRPFHAAFRPSTLALAAVFNALEKLWRMGPSNKNGQMVYQDLMQLTYGSLVGQELPAEPIIQAQRYLKQIVASSKAIPVVTVSSSPAALSTIGVKRTTGEQTAEEMRPTKRAAFMDGRLTESPRSTIDVI